MLLSFQVPGDGDCQYNAILAQIAFDSEEDRDKYCCTTMYLRRQLVVHVLRNSELIREALVELIRGVYGSHTEREQVGPFSFIGYLKYLLTPKSYGDSITTQLIASMWGLRITVIRSDSCKPQDFRHDQGIPYADLILLHNCNMSASGHYSACLRTDGHKLLAGPSRKAASFNEKVDLAELRELLGGGKKNKDKKDKKKPSGKKKPSDSKADEEVEILEDIEPGEQGPITLADHEVVIKKVRYNELLDI